MAKHVACVVVLWALLVGPTDARADIVHYIHPHPMPPGVGQGMCHIEGPHIHSFRPAKPVLYVEVEGQYAFIGDPTEFEPKARKYAYYGHHPVFWVDAPGEVEHYCYITGPHYHLYAPPPELKFTAKGGVYWYVGAHPGWYRKRYKKYRPVDRYYASVRIARPVVTVEPPEGFVGVYIGAGGRARVHGHVGGGVHIVPPPPPGIDVNIHLPGVGVVFGGAPVPHRRGVIVHKRRGPPRHAPAWGHRGRGPYKVKYKVKGKRKGKWK